LREVVLDSETTGLDPFDGHRVVEIGCVELVNCIPTGRVWHAHLNPERDVPMQAVEVHGLTLDFLCTKPRFHERAAELLAFIEGAMLVMHNAAFDFAFLNAELERAALPLLSWDRVVDTLALARRRHPGASCSLDTLCKRYGIDLSEREKHSALLDCQLLALVYVELVGGHQARLDFAVNGGQGALLATRTGRARPRPVPLAPRLTLAEMEAHRAFVATLGKGALWLPLLDTIQQGMVAGAAASAPMLAGVGATSRQGGGLPTGGLSG
jgi:DNA polymerase-3 subunit epsilon